MIPTTRSLLSILKNRKVIRIKKNSAKYKNVLLELEEESKKNKNIRFFESKEPEEIIILLDVNYIVDSFMV